MHAVCVARLSYRRRVCVHAVDGVQGTPVVRLGSRVGNNSSNCDRRRVSVHAVCVVRLGSRVATSSCIPRLHILNILRSGVRGLGVRD